MSKVDDVFDFADELIDEWGHYVTFVRKENSVYDPETGSTTETVTEKASQGRHQQARHLRIRRLVSTERRQDHPRPRPSRLHLHHRPGLLPRPTGKCTRRNDEGDRTRYLSW